MFWLDIENIKRGHHRKNTDCLDKNWQQDVCAVCSLVSDKSVLFVFFVSLPAALVSSKRWNINSFSIALEMTFDQNQSFSKCCGKGYGKWCPVAICKHKTNVLLHIINFKNNPIRASVIYSISNQTVVL